MPTIRPSGEKALIRNGSKILGAQAVGRQRARCTRRRVFVEQRPGPTPLANTIVIEPAKLYWCQEGTSGRASIFFGMKLVYMSSDTIDRFQARVSPGGEKESHVYKRKHNWAA